MAHDPTYPSHADQYAKDVRDWFVATEIPEQRQGQFVICFLGGAARRLFEDMSTHEKRHVCQLRDPQGRIVRVSVVEFILGVL